MEIKITAKTDISYFISDKVIPRIKSRFYNTCDIDKLSRFDNLINTSAYNVLLYCLNNLSVSRIGNDVWIIRPNTMLKYNNILLGYYINFITYGNRSIMGYRILPDVFRFISNNINELYEEYINGL